MFESAKRRLLAMFLASAIALGVVASSTIAVYGSIPVYTEQAPEPAPERETPARATLEPEEEPEPEPQNAQLGAPTWLNLNDGLLTWSKVEHSSAYRVYVNGTHKANVERLTPSFNLLTLNLDSGTYRVQVRALSDNVNSRAHSELSTSIDFVISSSQGDNDGKNLEEITGEAGLPAPTNLSVDQNGLLTWDAVPGITNYGVLINGTWFDFSGTQTNSLDLRHGLSYPSFLTTNTWEVSVRAENRDTNTFSNWALLPVQVPTTLAAPVISITGDTVSWTAVPNALNYAILVDGEARQTVGNNTSVSVSDSGWFGEAGDYEIQVRAVGADFDFINIWTLVGVWAMSELSNSVTFTQSDLPRLPAPNLTINNSVLSWNRIAGAEFYALYIQGSDWPVSIFSSSHLQVDLRTVWEFEEGETYQLHMVAMGNNISHFNSLPSNTVNYTPDGSDAPRYETPILTLDGSIIRWIGSSGSYEIEIDGHYFAWSDRNFFAPRTFPLNQGITYQIRVRALSSIMADTSEWSDPISFTLPPLIQPGPGQLAATTFDTLQRDSTLTVGDPYWWGNAPIAATITVAPNTGMTDQYIIDFWWRNEITQTWAPGSAGSWFLMDKGIDPSDPAKLTGVTFVFPFWGLSDDDTARLEHSGTYSLVAFLRSPTDTQPTNSIGVSESINLTIRPITVHVESVAVAQGNFALAAGSTHQLSAVIYPSNATNHNVRWSTSNASVATVSESGLVRGVSAGTATITVTTVDGNQTATIEVTVTGTSTGGGNIGGGHNNNNNDGRRRPPAPTFAPASAPRQTVSEASVNDQSIRTQLNRGVSTITLTLSEGTASTSVYAATLRAMVEAGASLRLVNGNVYAAFPTELIRSLDSQGGDTFTFSLAPSRADGNTLATVQISVSADNVTVTSLGIPVSILANISDIDRSNRNMNRITAVNSQGQNIGGSYNGEYFEFQTMATTANYTVAYVPSLRRATLQLGSPVITDLTGNGARRSMDTSPMVVEGRTLVPIRYITEDVLGLPQVGWDDATRTVTLTDGGRTLQFAIGEMAPGMDVPAQIVNGRTMVPIRFVSEFFNSTVNFNDSTRTIEIIR
ncbi:MAG: stalk domain-containing protein [Defluviitaleaceae bacterium]|nr:stalk domain-containing protein [Defluviitaleaceae bacterium]